MKTYKHPASGAELAREIAQPHVETFSDCFPDFKPRDISGPKRERPFAPRCVVGQNIANNLFKDCSAIMQGNPAARRHSDESMSVGPFLSHKRADGDHAFADVRCADWVLSRIKERTIVIGDDTMSFTLIDHDNGWTLVLAKHNQICGSVWLAYIRTDSIPDLSLPKTKLETVTEGRWTADLYQVGEHVEGVATRGNDDPHNFSGSLQWCRNFVHNLNRKSA